MAWVELARAEREDFAAFLETLSPQQWEAATLCERWNVREVAGHAISFDELTRTESVRRFLKGRLMVDRINQIGVDDYADRTPDQLIELIRRYGTSRYAPTIRGAWRARGVHLVGTDIEWSHGKGPDVQGPGGEALLMAMAGRPDALKDVSGPGKDQLSRRIDR